MKNSIFLSFTSLLISCAIVGSGCDLAQPQNQDQRRQLVGMDVPLHEEAPPPAPQQNEPEMVEVRADASAEVRGRSYGQRVTGNPADFVTVPISVMFGTRARLAMQNLERAMNEFRALNDGRFPASQEEFDEKIIRAYNIQLPQLRPDQTYVYDPASGELRVRGPRDAQ